MFCFSSPGDCYIAWLCSLPEWKLKARILKDRRLTLTYSLLFDAHVSHTALDLGAIGSHA
jgi:hypothetical protein